ncbi:rrp8 [Symbiodinium natans]|uniref:Ribosomal RNA-processing protein 8 n=1 Tax=Symbiodinium natans TaxID=878477 RepID=A0A812TKM7_9DINO|nr:rrp8 [Symbiodinium natans]
MYRQLAVFRCLNESLYTMTGQEALSMFSDDPSLAEAYHEGFRAQAAKWPRNPLDGVISWLRQEVPKDAVIGDFGCGDARLALELSQRKVHSFDLVQINERVTACNLAHVPLPDASLDVAVFCLALMGTDWIKFVEEAHRCLKPGGLCHIVEVESRFADVQAVVRTIESAGFQRLVVKPGSFFVELRFKRTKHKPEAAAEPSRKKGAKKRKGEKEGTGSGALLGACTYRKR